MTVDSGYGQWLRDPASYRLFEDAAIKAAWGDLAIETEIVTSIALLAGANSEGPRQLDFLKGPLVKDTALVAGRRKDLIGKAIVGKCDRLGYEGAGKTVFVVGARENGNKTTTLTIIRKL